jgi:hypothetical protein
MKKILIVLLGVTFLASCNRESDSTSSSQGGELSSAEVGLIHFDASQLEGDFTPMNESTSISGKTGSQLNYTFRGYADPVEIGAVDLAASAVFQVEDMIFVAWHTNDYGALTGSPVGPGTVSGSLCAYRLSGIGQYELKDRVDFEQHDLYALSAHRNTVTGNYEVMVTGQRNTDNSQYVLSGHQGAIVARMDYDYINDEFWEGSLTELPLIGVAGTGIVAVGSQFFVTSGDGMGGSIGQGGLFQVDRSLRNVIAYRSDFDDAIDIQVDPTTITGSAGSFYVLERANSTGVDGVYANASIKIWSYNYDGSVLGIGSEVSYNGDFDSDGAPSPVWTYDGDNDDIIPVDQAKGHLVIAQGRTSETVSNTLKLDSMLINYGVSSGGTSPESSFVYKATGGNLANGTEATGPRIIDTYMSMGNFSSITFDPSLGVLYCGGGEDANLKVIAMGKYSGDNLLPGVDPKPFVSTNDLVGTLTLPSTITNATGGTVTVTGKAVNDITVYQNRHIAISLGDNGLMFIQRDN